MLKICMKAIFVFLFFVINSGFVYSTTPCLERVIKECEKKKGKVVEITDAKACKIRCIYHYCKQVNIEVMSGWVDKCLHIDDQKECNAQKMRRSGAEIDRCRWTEVDTGYKPPHAPPVIEKPEDSCVATANGLENRKLNCFEFLDAMSAAQSDDEYIKLDGGFAKDITLENVKDGAKLTRFQACTEDKKFLWGTVAKSLKEGDTVTADNDFDGTVETYKILKTATDEAYGCSTLGVGHITDEVPYCKAALAGFSKAYIGGAICNYTCVNEKIRAVFVLKSPNQIGNNFTYLTHGMAFRKDELKFGANKTVEIGLKLFDPCPSPENKDNFFVMTHDCQFITESPTICKGQ